jgi:hypothetical protein
LPSFKFIGPGSTDNLGYHFPEGVAVPVDDLDAIARLSSHPEFVLAESQNSSTPPVVTAPAPVAVVEMVQIESVVAVSRETEVKPVSVSELSDEELERLTAPVSEGPVEVSVAETGESAEAQVRRGGRPKGSKNKPKEDAAS